MAGYERRTKRLMENFDDLSDKEKDDVMAHVLDFAADRSIKRSDEIEIDGMFEHYDEIMERMKSYGHLVGLSTGYRALDRMTMGLAPGEMTIIGGATSNGKTILAINIAAKVLRAGKSVLFVTLEMTKEELGVRFKKVMGEGFEKHMSNLYLQHNDELNWRSIDGLIKRAKEDCKVDLVIIDHLHYFTRELRNVAEELGNITKEFKKNAIRHQLPIIVISHTRKLLEAQSAKANINDLRGSSYIAQDADIVLLVHRDNDYPDYIVVTLEKNRNRYGCRIGTVENFLFENLQIIEVLDEGKEEDDGSPQEIK